MEKIDSDINCEMDCQGGVPSLVITPEAHEAAALHCNTLLDGEGRFAVSILVIVVNIHEIQ